MILQECPIWFFAHICTRIQGFRTNTYYQRSSFLKNKKYDSPVTGKVVTWTFAFPFVILNIIKIPQHAAAQDVLTTRYATDPSQHGRSWLMFDYPQLEHDSLIGYAHRHPPGRQTVLFSETKRVQSGSYMLFINQWNWSPMDYQQHLLISSLVLGSLKAETYSFSHPYSSENSIKLHWEKRQPAVKEFSRRLTFRWNYER